MSSSCQTCGVLPSRNLNYSLCSPLLRFHSYQSSPTTSHPGPSICPAVTSSSPSVTSSLSFLPIQGPQFGNLSIHYSPIPCPAPPGRCHLILNLQEFLERSLSHPSPQPPSPCRCPTMSPPCCPQTSHAVPMPSSHSAVPKLAMLDKSSPHRVPPCCPRTGHAGQVTTPLCPHRVPHWPRSAHGITPLCCPQTGHAAQILAPPCPRPAVPTLPMPCPSHRPDRKSVV